MAEGIQSITALVGRFLLSAIFLASGVHKLTAWSETVVRVEQEGLATAPLFLAIAVVLELGGGLSLLLGYKTRLGALALIAFLIPVTAIMHDFWTYDGPERQTQMINFMKNLAILGGLCMTLAFGSGRFAVDRPKRRTTD